MKLTAISLLSIIMILPLVSAISFTFDHPESVNTNENFSVSISATLTGNYDVKIIVQDNKTSTTLSEIYNDGWKSSYYYLPSAFPDKSNFIIRAKSASDSAVICAKLRKHDSSSTYSKCDIITTIQSVSSNADTSPDSSSKSDISNSEIQSEQNSANTIEPKQDFVPSVEQSTSNSQSNSVDNSDKIYLNTKSSSQNQNQDTFTTSSEKLRIYAVYAFTALTLFVLIFIAFKRI